MGDNHTFDDSSLSECYPFGFDVHIPAEKVQSWCKRKGWERVQAPDCCFNAREQMYIRDIFDMDYPQTLTVCSSGRQYLHQ